MNVPLGEALEGKYEILDKIGEGGMGSVYKVRHRLLEEVRVIKVLRPHAAEMEDLQRRFLREARMAIKLKHPNIAQLHDFSIATDGTAYIVMEFIDGIGLDAMIKTSDPPSVDLALELSTQTLAALHYLHEHQFVHRDVSPDNLMLTSNFDGSPLIKLIDLGIAKNLDAEVPLTQTGVFLGKVRYCSPEQFSGKQGEEQELDRGSDIYSFGVLLYELLTGVYPFYGESFAELAGSHLFQPPKAFVETDPDSRIPQGVRDIVLTALEKERDQRFATAAEFSEELAAFRAPDVLLTEEFDRTVQVTGSALPKAGEYSKPGSTQGRLDREFGLEETTAPRLLTDSQITAAQPVAENAKRAVANIEKLLAAGKLANAEKFLVRAVDEHGQIALLANLREQLEKAKTAPSAVAHKGRALTPIRIASAVAVLALVATAIVLWSISSRSEAPDVEATDQIADVPSESPPVLFVPTERWSANEAAAPTFETDVFAIAEPPPFEDDSTDEPIASAVRDEIGPPRPVVEEVVQEEPVAVEPPPAQVAATQTRTVPAPPTSGEAETFPPGVGVVAPVLLELPDPQIPPGAKAPKQEVVYSVRVFVDEFGKVITAQVESGPAFKRRLRHAAAEAAKQARFQPASKDGVAGRMWTEVRIVFAPQ